MEKRIEKLKEQIKAELKYAENIFTGWDEGHKRNMARIQGMIASLEIITDKKYTYDDFR